MTQRNFLRKFCTGSFSAHPVLRLSYKSQGKLYNSIFTIHNTAPVILQRSIWSAGMLSNKNGLIDAADAVHTTGYIYEYTFGFSQD